MEQHPTQYQPLFANGKQASWRTQRAVLFPSDDSLRWWLRFHRDEAVRRGGLILVAGRWVATPELDALVREIGQRQARQAIGDLSHGVAA